jgi:DNA-binding response OmpR family regulator
MSKTIVWIEDDIELIKPVIRPLEQSGYKFLYINSAQEAIKCVDNIRKADLILLDMILPPGQEDTHYGRYAGIDILRELRDKHGIGTPVIVFSVVNDEGIIHKLNEFGVTDIIRKPVLPSELKKRVEEALGHSE